MANIGAYAEKHTLDWMLGGASGTPPTTRGAGLSLGAPTSLSMSEVGTGSGYTPQTVTFAAAASPAGSVSNANAMTFGPFSSAQSVSGIFMKDTLGTAGNLWWYGTLTTARTVAPGDQLVVAAGQLIITLA